MKIHNLKAAFLKTAWLLLLLLGIAGGWLLVNGLGLQEGTIGIEAVMAVLILGAFVFLIVMKRQGRVHTEMLIGTILFLGCVMRIGYMLYTPCTLRGHDLFEMDVNAYGKAGYLLRLILERRLPESNALQLYQQPFFYLVGALVSKGLNGILGETDVFFLVDASKTVSCLASCLTLFVVRRLFEALDIGKKGTLYGMLVVAFTPVFYLTGGRVSENALCIFFMAAAFLYTRYWERQPGWKNTVILALIYGFGMMTKISVAVAALYTAWIFIKKLFWQRLPKKERPGLYVRLAVFGGISLPLGLWYSLRNMYLFHQGLTYVLVQDVNGPLYFGKVSLVQRFLLPDVGNMLRTPYANPLTDSNLFTYLLKTELFGEFSYEIADWIPTILLFLNLVISLGAIGCCIRLLRQGRKSREGFAIAGWLLLFTGFAVKSYLSYPFGCTMDFRYYVMISVCKALLIGKLTEDEPQGFFTGLMKRCVVLYSIFSCLMYCCI